MTRIKTPNHNYPIKHVAISASQNVYGSQDRVDKKEANSIEHYLRNNAMVSLKFGRTADSIRGGFDENKAAFPVYGPVPLFAITTIAAVESGMQVSVTGSRDVGEFVKELKGYYLSIGNMSKAGQLSWVPELDGLDDPNQDDREIIAKNRKKLTLGNSLSRLAGSLDLQENDSFIFTAGDILFYDYPRVAHDKDSIDHSMVMDFNGQERIDPPIPRNYYHRLLTKAREEIHFKEPNVYIFGKEFNLELSNDSYSNAQKGGFGIKAFLGMAGKNMIKNSDMVSTRDIFTVVGGVLKEIAHYGLKKVSNIRYIPQHSVADVESISKFLHMSPIRVKVEHDDYLRLKDVDAMHDYVFVRRLLEKHLADVFPEDVARSIKGFARHLQGTPIVAKLSEFPDRLNDKVDRINAIFIKKKSELRLQMPFGPRGDFRAEPTEDLEAAVERSKRDLERYYERRAAL